MNVKKSKKTPEKHENQLWIMVKAHRGTVSGHHVFQINSQQYFTSRE